MSGRILQLSHNFSVGRALLSSLAEPLKVTGKNVYEEGLLLWKKIFFFGAIPVSSLCFLNIYLMEEPERLEFKKYSYLRIRRNKYPWRDGVKTLFHSHNNALPDGYEDELGDHH